MFAPGQELATYRDADECVQQVGRFLEDEAGPQRTLREHSYAQRMEQLANLLAKHLS